MPSGPHLPEDGMPYIQIDGAFTRSRLSKEEARLLLSAR